MAELAKRLESLPGAFAEAAERYRVPGASLAIALGDEQFELATGVLNANTGVEATTDSVFQVGSITKLFTATLVMQLVEEGRVALDEPVRTYLPGLAFADPVATECVTLRHILTHTSGIDGDFFLDTGRGDDCVERYILALGALPQLHPVGEMFSYCNAGFVVAGRVIERLTGTTWDTALRQRLLDPIGATTMGTLPEEALLFRAAAGHVAGPGGAPRLAPAWSLPRSNGPAGATPFAAARDLLAFARMIMAGGMGAGGRVLSEESVRAMLAPEIELDPQGDPTHRGLGWMLFDWGGRRVVGHDGATIGQSSYLRILPGEGLAVSLLTNGGNAPALYRRVFGEVFGALAGIGLPPLPEPTEGFELDPAPYVGSYEKLSARIEVELAGGELRATIYPLKVIVPDAPLQVLALRPIDRARFVAKPAEGGIRQVMTFSGFGPEGRPGYLLAGRLHRRVR